MLQPTPPTHAALAPFLYEGELRVRDVDLGTRLGFGQPRDIRPLIARHGAALSQMGVLAEADEVVGKGQKVTATFLNKKQAIFITAKSDTPTAMEITIEIIEKFDAYERGAVDSISHVAHRPSVAFQGYFQVARLIGFDPNQAALSAGKAAKATTGENPLESMGITHMAAALPDAMLTPTDLGAQIGGLSAQSVNKLLEERGLQTSLRDLKNKIIWEATDAGKPHSVMLDTAKKYSNGTPIKQIKWLASVIELLRLEPMVEAETSIIPSFRGSNFMDENAGV